MDRPSIYGYYLLQTVSSVPTVSAKLLVYPVPHCLTKSELGHPSILLEQTSYVRGMAPERGRSQWKPLISLAP